MGYYEDVMYKRDIESWESKNGSKRYIGDALKFMNTYPNWMKQ